MNFQLINSFDFTKLIELIDINFHFMAVIVIILIITIIICLFIVFLFVKKIYTRGLSAYNPKIFGKTSQ